MTRQAVVIGASIAGLLAARVLAPHFNRVTIIERDDLEDAGAARKAVPQGKHIHVIWSGGADVLERLFPGFWQELEASGAVSFDNSRDMRWFHRGVWKLRTDSGLTMHSQSRPLLEYRIRNRLQEHDNVDFLTGHVVAGLTTDTGRHRVTGVRLVPRSDATGTRDLAAELVVDASGRGSKTPAWLADMGYAPPPEQQVGIDLRYASRLYEIPELPGRDWKVMAIYARPPVSKRSGVIFPIEGNRWIVTLAGCLGDHPPADESGFLEFARGLDRPELYQAIRHAAPASPIAVYGFPRESRRRYDRLERLPEGLVVVGDALCAFNPLYGQGVSVCALEAEALQACLEEASGRGKPGLDGLPGRYFKRAADILAGPWLLATGTDCMYPEATGDRPRGMRLLGWYNDQLLGLSSCDPTVLIRFLEVLHFLKPPAALFQPAIVLRALKWWLGLRPASAPAEAALRNSQY